MRQVTKQNPITVIAEQLQRKAAALLPTFEGSIDPRIRRQLAPDERAYSAEFDRCFRIVRTALKGNPRAERALFELEEAANGLTAAQADVSRAVGMAISAQSERRRDWR